MRRILGPIHITFLADITGIRRDSTKIDYVCPIFPYGSTAVSRRIPATGPKTSCEWGLIVVRTKSGLTKSGFASHSNYSVGVTFRSYFGHHGLLPDILYHVILQFMLHEGSRGSNEIHYKMVALHFLWVCYNILLSLVS